MQPKSIILACAIAASCLFSGQALSQTAADQDWQLIQVPERKATLATIEFDPGITLTARCIAGDFEFSVTGLPALNVATRSLRIGSSDEGLDPSFRSENTSRPLRIAIGDEPLEDETWTVASRSDAAFSRLPAIFVRRLARGGRLQIVVPGVRGQHSQRYIMDLLPSAMALERTLTACQRSMIDPRDRLISGNAPDGLTSDLGWAREPIMAFPDAAAVAGIDTATVTVSCIADAEGKPTHCVIESENPGGFHFGQAVLQGVESGRLKMVGNPQSNPAGRCFLVTIRFRLEPSSPQPLRNRGRGRSPRQN